MGYVRWWLIGMVPMLLPGCTAPKTASSSNPVLPPPLIDPVAQTNAIPTIRPLGGTLGRVVSVNARLRFVVLDFTLNPLPQPGDHFELVRVGVVVGEVKISGFIRGISVAADVIDGEAAVGDQVRLK